MLAILCFFLYQILKDNILRSSNHDS